MKSFFSLKESLALIRDIPGEILETISVRDLYDLVIEIIDLVKHSRAFVTKDSRKRNDGMKTVQSGYNNPGGLARVKFPSSDIPVTKEELKELTFLITRTIMVRDAILQGRSLPEQLDLFKQVEFSKVTVQERTTCECKRTATQKGKQHFYHKRRKGKH
jgi:hypothetical protein